MVVMLAFIPVLVACFGVFLTNIRIARLTEEVQKLGVTLTRIADALERTSNDGKDKAS